MALQMIYGRAHSGKTQYILNAVAALQKEDKPVLMIVPEQFTHIAEKRLLAKIGTISRNRAEVLSFDRMAKRINYAYQNKREQITPIGKSLIMAEILEKIKLDYYKNSAVFQGFADLCIQEISEFKKYNLTPKDIGRAAENASDKLLELKLKDMSRIYTEYENQIGTAYADSDDAMDFLYENLNTYRPYEGFAVFFDEFSSFTPQEKNIIAALSIQCANLYAAFCVDTAQEYSALFKPTVDAANAIIEVCTAVGCPTLPAVRLTNSFYQNKELCILERYLYSYPSYEYGESCSNIRLFAAENPYSEVLRTATQISALVRERGARYRDIGVICSDINAYSHIFRSVFDAFSIPYFVDEKVRVLDHSIIVFIINIFDVYIQKYNSETVVNFLKSGFISAERSAVNLVDNFVLATNATKNTWLNEERWQASVMRYAAGDKTLADSLNSVRERYILPLSVLHDCIKGRQTVKFITEQLYNYLIKSGFSQTISEYIRRFQEDKNHAMAKQYQSVWKTLIDALDRLVYILGDKTVNLIQYRKYLYTAFGQQKIGMIPTSLDEIIIGDIKRTKTEYVQYQFVLGVNDGLFPLPAREESILTDKDKESLEKFGVQLSSTSSELAYYERFLIYSVFTLPMQSLILSYPCADNTFSALRPAFVVSNLKRMFQKLHTQGGLFDDPLLSVCNETTAKQYLVKCAGELAVYRKTDPHWMDIYQYFKDKKDMETIAMVNQLTLGKQQIAKLDSSLTKRLYPDEFYTTVSRLQKYNACCYSYFLEYTLGLKEKKIYGLQSMDIGSLIHDILDGLFKAVQEKHTSLAQVGSDFIKGYVDLQMGAYVENMKKFNAELSQREIFAIERLKTTVVKSILVIQNHLAESKFEPMGSEMVFDDTHIGCIEIKLANGKTLKITGKIDRADCYENERGKYIRIIDYKTGSKTFHLSDVFYGLDIQLMVYLNAVVDKTAQGNYGGALFFKIQDPMESFDTIPEDAVLQKKLATDYKMSGLIPEDEIVRAAYDPVTAKLKSGATFTQFCKLDEYLQNYIREAAYSISEGSITINPYKQGTSSPCDYCKYMSICKFNSDKTTAYRPLPKMEQEEIWKEICKEIGACKNELES